MFCSNCGNELQEGQFFCPKCGAKIRNDSEPALRQPSSFAKKDATTVSSNSAALDRLAIIPLVFAMLSYAFPYMASVLSSASAFEFLGKSFYGLFLGIAIFFVLLATFFSCINEKMLTIICSCLALTLYIVISVQIKSEVNEYWNFGAGFYAFITAMVVAIGLSIWRGLENKENV